MKKVWITGANGLIGSYLQQTAARFAPDISVRPLTRNDFDILDSRTIEKEFKKDSPDLIIHCAAISTVAEAQKNPVEAKRINVDATRFLCELAHEIQFVFFSTDLVFDGRKGNYVETDAGNPLHVYGETKFAAEQIVSRNPGHLVIRTSINGGVSKSGNRAFNEQLHHSLKNAGQGMTLFVDEFRNPIPAFETARAVWELTEKHCTGIFHVAGAEKLSRWQIGELLVKRWPDVTAKISSGSAKDFAGPPRALDTSLNISKVQPVLTKPLPGLGEWLAAHPQELF